MKPLLSLLALAFFAATVHAELSIVSSGHRDADSFKRLCEYLTGKQSDGRYEVFRSDESRRDGFYVSLYLPDRATLDRVSTVMVHYVRPGTQEVESAETAAGALQKKRLLIGLTEPEWDSEDSRPVAWKIELADASGAILESAESFLWAEPR